MPRKGNRKPKKQSKKSKAARDNRSRQLNDKDDAYWQSRGHPGRPFIDRIMRG